MRLFWCPRTRASRAVWMLEEAGIDYERVCIDIRDAESKSDAGFRAASPMGKVPALEDGDIALADSAAICLYIADRYASGSLAPPVDDADRGRFLYWMFFSPGTMEPAMAEKIGGWTSRRGQHGWGDFDSMIVTLEEGLSQGPWLLGQRFSAADVMVGSTAAFMRMFDLLPDSPLIDSYVDRCLARPAYQRAQAMESAD
ncbi:MAG: glutathione S-transferase family protein [Chromatiales bacterium]|nr:glutathione S-transferase family protein [Chromatiales bacterium]MDH4030572.1 glutathione S-transferase family protein [Chromatiales bacterium]